MFYRCSRCGLAFYFATAEESQTMRPNHFCAGASPEIILERIDFEAVSRSNTYSEAGGDIVGIDTTTTIETAIAEGKLIKRMKS